MSPGDLGTTGHVVRGLSLRIILLEEEWQQLRGEASQYGVSLETIVASHISGDLMRNAAPFAATHRRDTSVQTAAQGPSETE
jgi:hypothetical protein